MSENARNLKKIQVRSKAVCRNFSRGGKLDILLILSMLLTIQYQCTFIIRFAISTPWRKCPLLRRGVTSGGQGDTIPWAPNHYEGAVKSQQCHKYFLQYRTFASKDLRFEHRGAKPACCPGRHLTSLCPCCHGSSRNNRASLAQQCTLHSTKLWSLPVLALTV